MTSRLAICKGGRQILPPFNFEVVWEIGLRQRGEEASDQDMLQEQRKDLDGRKTKRKTSCFAPVSTASV